MVTTTPRVEVEIDSHNCNVVFAPLRDRKLRGRVDFSTIDRDGIAKRQKEWGVQVVPGKRIAVDPQKKVGIVSEPIHGDPALKQKVERRFRLEPETETFEQIDVDAWLRAIALLVQAGHARLISGELPEVRPLVEAPSPMELLAASEYARLTPEQRETADEFILKMRRRRR